MPKKLTFLEELRSTNGPIVDKGNFTTQFGSNQNNIVKNNKTLKKVKLEEKKADLQYDLDNYNAYKVFHDNNPLAFNRKKLPTSMPATTKEILNGLGAGIENFYRIPQLGELNEFVNPLHIASSGIITPWAQAPLQSEQSGSLLPYGMAGLSTALTVPFIKPSGAILRKGVQQTWNAPRKFGQVYRDIKYPVNTITKDGKLYHNSYDFLKQNNFKKGLNKEEINFLNTEAKDRGILETQRRHPLNIFSELSSRGIVAENYNAKKAIKDYIPNILKGKEALKSQYTMGQSRTDAFDHYLGKPIKNNPYRVHSNSFKNGNDLVYTMPEKLINRIGATETVQPFTKEEFNTLSHLEDFYKNSSEQNKSALYEQLTKQYGKNKLGLTSYKRFNPDLFLKGPQSEYGIPIIKNNKTVIPGVDYITGTGGGAPFIKEGNKVTMKDMWDIQPFSRNKRLPKFMQNFNANKILGGKDFMLNQTYTNYPSKLIQTFKKGGNYES